MLRSLLGGWRSLLARKRNTMKVKCVWLSEEKHAHTSNLSANLSAEAGGIDVRRIKLGLRKPWLSQV